VMGVLVLGLEGHVLGPGLVPKSLLPSLMLLMLQHRDHSRIGTRPRRRKRKKSSLYSCCDFSGGWYNFEKIIEIVANLPQYVVF